MREKIQKIMLTKSQFFDLETTNAIYDLWEGYCMNVIRTKRVKNRLGFTKYYKIYVRCCNTQKEVVDALKHLGIIDYGNKND